MVLLILALAAAASAQTPACGPETECGKTYAAYTGLFCADDANECFGWHPKEYREFLKRYHDVCAKDTEHCKVDRGYSGADRAAAEELLEPMPIEKWQKDYAGRYAHVLALYQDDFAADNALSRKGYQDAKRMYRDFMGLWDSKSLEKELSRRTRRAFPGANCRKARDGYRCDDDPELRVIDVIEAYLGDDLRDNLIGRPGIDGRAGKLDVLRRLEKGELVPPDEESAYFDPEALVQLQRSTKLKEDMKNAAARAKADMRAFEQGQTTASDGGGEPAATNLAANPPAFRLAKSFRSAASPRVRIAPADGRFRYEGRFDFSDANSPVVIWQGSRISLEFEGDAITLLFDHAKGQSFFDAQAEDASTVVEIREGRPPRGADLAGFGAGRHKLTLFKRSEATAGTVHFGGVGLPAGAQAWRSPPPGLRPAMEFLGDSISVGACNEDGAEDQWQDRITHDNALSYPALTAAAFSADYRNVAVSGMGIAAGYTDVKAGEIWDRLYPTASSPRADLRAWTPTVVFVHLGENDASFSKAHGQPFPEGYTDGYVSLVRSIRAAYPRAHIVLLLGGMSGGSESRPLRRAWEAACASLEKDDRGISHFAFKHWSSNHPRVADDRILADELIGWLKQQDFL